MLFDHGCDAFSIGFVLTINSKLMNLGDNIWTMLFIMGGVATFHFSTLEEYYVGGMHMGPFNCVSDLTFPLMALWFYCGMYTNEKLQTVVFEENHFYESSGLYRVIDLMVVFSWGV